MAGLAIGAGGGIAVGSKVNLLRDTGVTHAQSMGTGACWFGLLGAAAGGIVGVDRTLYKIPASAPKPRR